MPSTKTERQSARLVREMGIGVKGSVMEIGPKIQVMAAMRPISAMDLISMGRLAAVLACCDGAALVSCDFWGFCVSFSFDRFILINTFLCMIEKVGAAISLHFTVNQLQELVYRKEKGMSTKKQR